MRNAEKLRTILSGSDAFDLSERAAFLWTGYLGTTVVRQVFHLWIVWNTNDSYNCILWIPRQHSIGPVISEVSHQCWLYIQSRGVGLDLSQNTGFSYVSLALLLLVRLLFGFASEFCLSFLQFLSNSTTDCETAIGCLGDRFWCGTAL